MKMCQHLGGEQNATRSYITTSRDDIVVLVASFFLKPFRIARSSLVHRTADKKAL